MMYQDLKANYMPHRINTVAKENSGLNNIIDDLIPLIGQEIYVSKIYQASQEIRLPWDKKPYDPRKDIPREKRDTPVPPTVPTEDDEMPDVNPWEIPPKSPPGDRPPVHR